MWLAILPPIALAQPAADQPAPASESAPAPKADPQAATEPGAIPVTPPGDSAQPPAPPAASRNRLIEEVVVTAQKREEALQDVPISIQAYNHDQLDALGVQSVQDVQRVAPGFTVTSAAGFNIVFLRGVGSDAFLPGIDSSVPFYLDGVPLLAAQSTSDTLGRVERIEVLKGPQGTLFGRNATGGAISIVTPNPDQVFAADLKAELGNYDQRNISGYLNVPLSDTLAFNLAGFDSDRRNHLKTLIGDTPDIHSRGGRLKLRWDVQDNLALTASGNYQRSAGNGGTDWQLTRPAPLLFGAVLPADPKLDRFLDRDGPVGTDIESYLLSGVGEWRGDAFDSKLTYSYQRVNVLKVEADFDGSSMPVANAYGGGIGGAHQFLKQQTVELQFLSNQGSLFAEHFEWVAGFFYLSSLGGFDPVAIPVVPDALNALLPSNGSQSVTAVLDQVLTLINSQAPSDGFVKLANYGLIDTDSYSIYAQGTFHIVESLDLTTGVRVQREFRDLVGSRTSLLTDDNQEIQLPLPQADLHTLAATQVSPRVALQWRPFGEGSQIYTSWARGFKSPTYNAVNFLGNLFGTMVPLKEERVDTTELGFKSDLLDGNLRLNAATFFTKQKDPLSGNVSITSGGFTYFTNAGSAEIKGVEADFLLTPLPSLDPGLVVAGSGSYVDAKYTDFKNGQGYDDVTGLGFGGGGARLPPRDLSGKRIPRVPEWSYQLTISQRFDLDDNNAIELGADTFFTSKIYFLPQNSDLSKRDPVQLYNARVSYFYNPWGLELSVYGNNLADKTYVDSAFVTDFGTALIANPNPRLYGLRAKLSF